MKLYIRNEIDIHDLQSIEAMATIGSDNKAQTFYFVSPDSGRIGEPYFKVGDGVSFSKSEHIARISFLEPKYVIHTDGTGKPHWYLTSKDKKQMNQFFVRINKLLNVMYWQYALYQWNKDYKFIVQTGEMDGNRPLELSMFLKGEYDTLRNLTHPSYLPSYLEIPDYTKL